MENNTDITINGSTATWKLPNIEGQLGGTYTGFFVFKAYLNPLESLQAGRELRELLGSFANNATDTEFNLAYALTQLKQRVIKAPPFWTSPSQEENSCVGNIGDLNVISLILDAAMRAEALFKEKIAKEREILLERSIKIGEDLLQKNNSEE